MKRISPGQAIRLTTACLVLGAVVTIAPAQTPAAALDPLLAKIATYKYGQSREAMAQLTVLIESSMGSPAALREIESRLIRFLQSDATGDAKHAAFKELSRIATGASVPALSGMLMHEESAEMALYALARIPGRTADDALRKALEATTGKTRIGTINSLGQRRDAMAVPALRALAASSDLEVARAAIYALGRIGSRPAFDALSVTIGETSGLKRQHTVEAYLLCAGLLAAEGSRDHALKAYRQLNAAQETGSVQIAALNGLASLDARNSIPALTAAMESKSPAVVAAAIRLLAAIRGPEVTEILARQFSKLQPSGQVQLLAALAQRGDVTAKPLMAQAVQTTAPSVQVAALAGLGKLGDESSIAVLAEAAATGKGPVQTAARESLALLRGPNVDAAIVKALGTSRGALKSEFILAAGERRSPGAADILIQTVRDPDPEVRRAALRALRKVAGPEQVPGLIEALKNPDADDRSDAAQALAAALKKSQAEQIAVVISAYRSARAMETRLALLDALGQTSSTESLTILLEALKDPNPEIVRASILALTAWPDATPLPDLLALAKGRSEPALQILALRGYLKLLAMPSRRSSPESARLLGGALQLAKEPAEKRSALSQLTAYPSAEALKIAELYLNDPAVAVEAKASVDRIRSVLK